MKIYAASSWRNSYQPGVVALLRQLGHEVYDFRNPRPGNTGFSWSDIDANWKSWSAVEYRSALAHPIAEAGYVLDFDAMRWCDACVLILPAGRSASWELGWCMGAGKVAYIYIPEPVEPELMFRDAHIVTSLVELRDAFRTLEP